MQRVRTFFFYILEKEKPILKDSIFLKLVRVYSKNDRQCLTENANKKK